jgi:hypothetical protein
MSNYESKKSFEGVPPFATATEEEIQVSERFERGNWFTPIEPKPIYDGYAPARVRAHARGIDLSYIDPSNSFNTLI